MTNKEYKIGTVELQGVSMYHVDLVTENGDPIRPMRHVGLTVSWTANIGFGELHISDRGDGRIEIDAEGLPKEFVKAVLCKLVDDAKIREFPRCSACKKCATSLRSGGYFCPSCRPDPEDPPDEDEAALPKLIEAGKLVLGLAELGRLGTTHEALNDLEEALEYYQPWNDTQDNKGEDK